MLEALNRLLDSDTRARGRILAISAAVIVACGLIGEAFAETPFYQLQMGATLAGLIAFAVQFFFYRRSGNFQNSTISNKRVLFKSLGAITATAVLAFVAEFSGSRVQAAVLTKRLRSALYENRTELKVAAVTLVLMEAQRIHVKLSSQIIGDTWKELRQDDIDVAWKAYMALLEYTVNQKIDPPRRPSEAGDWLDNPPANLNKGCGPENYSYGADAQLWARGGEWITSSDLSRWPNTIHHCRLSLDGASLSDVYAWAVMVTYQGGPLHLKNVRLGPCRFDLPSGTKENVRKFVDALMSADRNILTIDLQ